jgi:hypothetical protein
MILDGENGSFQWMLIQRNSLKPVIFSKLICVGIDFIRAFQKFLSHTKNNLFMTLLITLVQTSESKIFARLFRKGSRKEMVKEVFYSEEYQHT